jgi:uncharacterized protein
MTEQKTARPLAVVTGASSGIGLELAKQFAIHGYDLVIAAEDDGIEQAARQLQKSGARVEPVQVDLSTVEGVEQLYSRAAQLGRVQAAAINAGIGVHGHFATTDLEEELRLVDLNVRSSVHLAKRFVHDMVQAHDGRILFTSSIAATAPGPYETVYAASKAFLYSFAEGLRGEMRDSQSNVVITALLPGPTDTDFFERAGMEHTKVGRMEKDDPADVAKEGFEALMSGKDHVVAGSVRNKVQAAVGRILPEQTKARIHGEQAKPQKDKPHKD